MTDSGDSEDHRLPDVSEALEIVHDLADQGRLSADPRLLAGGGDDLWHEVRRQDEAVAMLHDLVVNHHESIDDLCPIEALPGLVAGIMGDAAGDGVLEIDLDRIRDCANGRPLSNAIAVSLELACQQVSSSVDVTDEERRRLSTAIDVAGSFWLAFGEQVEAGMLVVPLARESGSSSPEP